MKLSFPALCYKCSKISLEIINNHKTNNHKTNIDFHQFYQLKNMDTSIQCILIFKKYSSILYYTEYFRISSCDASGMLNKKNNKTL